jgi:hypothetical protein
LRRNLHRRCDESTAYAKAMASVIVYNYINHFTILRNGLMVNFF